MSGFRTKLLVAFMLVVSVVTALAVYVSDRNLASTIERELERDFESELTALHHVQAIRHAALAERTRALVHRPRIHAALEDNALDLLYPNAEDELRDVLVKTDDAATDTHGPALRARFYRFLDRNGRVISPPADASIGELSPAIEAQLALPRIDEAQQVGYISLPDARGPIVEVIATPIISTETGEAIAALVLGFKSFTIPGDREMRSGVFVGGKLHFISAPGGSSDEVEREVAAIAPADEGSRRIEVGGAPHQLFFKRLNPGSRYPPAYEVTVYPLDQFAARKAELRFRIVSVGVLFLAVGFVFSQIVATRLSRPVEKLAVDSERSARFSADASHQLKTPVTVLRAGLEELLTRDNLTPDECDAIAALIHQTYRLSSLIEDLLLLSRMDSGRLKLALGPVDLSHLIACALDDLSATADDTSLEIQTDLPPVLGVKGEKRYTAMILQNLLENARKYNRAGGRIRVAGQVDGETVLLRVGNTGRTIAPAAQAHIFERFHRGAIGENVPGYGLGLNLARELARLHDGDLRLLRSGDDWTEFEVRFRVAQPVASPA